jgi:hypothetical protein
LCKNLFGISAGKRLLGRSSGRWYENVKIDLEEIRLEVVS